MADTAGDMIDDNRDGKITCKIIKNGSQVKEFMDYVQFVDNQMTGYCPRLRKLQAAVNQALTDIINADSAMHDAMGDHGQQQSTKEDDADEDCEGKEKDQNIGDQSETTKRKSDLVAHDANVPTKKCKNI